MHVALSHFARLPNEDIARAVPYFQKVRAKDGQILCLEGDSGDSMFIVDVGQVEVQHGGRPIAILAPGAAFGELALLENKPRTATCVAKGVTELAKLSAVGLEKLSREEPKLALRILRAIAVSLSSRFRRANRRAIAVMGADT